MKLKQSFRYQLADYKAGILVYYCAMLGLLALFLVSTVVVMCVTGWTAQLVMGSEENKAGKSKDAGRTSK